MRLHQILRLAEAPIKEVTVSTRIHQSLPPVRKSAMSQYPVRGIGTSPLVRTSSKYGTSAAIAVRSAESNSAGSSTSALSIPKDFAMSGKSGLYGVPSGRLNSVPYELWKYVVPTLRIVEKQKL